LVVAEVFTAVGRHFDIQIWNAEFQIRNGNVDREKQLSSYSRTDENHEMHLPIFVVQDRWRLLCHLCLPIASEI